MKYKARKKHLMPQQGDSTNLYERLLEYISISDRNWVNRIKPAKDSDIKLLKTLSKVEKYYGDFPKDYKVFLKYMGQNDCGLCRCIFPGTANIKDMIGFYNGVNNMEEHLENIDDINRYDFKYLSFFSQEIAGELAFDLSVKDNPTIVYTEYGSDENDIISENLEKLLFQCAFTKYEKYNTLLGFSCRGIDLQTFLTKCNEKDIFKIVEKFANENGFEKAWFSDSNKYIGYRSDISFLVKENVGLYGFLTGDCKEDVLKLGNYLASMIGVVNVKEYYFY